MSVHNSLPTQLILAHGSEDLKERYLRPMAEGRMLGAFALSEAHAGSDPAALSCSAVRRGDAWVLNGAKAWVTNGGTADVVLAMARTGGSGSRGVSAFVVEPTWKGYSVGKEEKKMGLRSSNTARDRIPRPRGPGGEPPRRGGEGAVVRPGGARARAARHRGPVARHRERVPRTRGRVGPRAEGLRPADRRLPGDPLPARRPRRADRSGARADLRRGREEGPRRARAQGGRHGQAPGQPGRDGRRREGDPGLSGDTDI